MFSRHEFVTRCARNCLLSVDMAAMVISFVLTQMNRSFDTLIFRTATNHLRLNSSKAQAIWLCDSLQRLTFQGSLLRIDYCCSLPAGPPFCTLTQMNRILRSATRLVGRLPKFSSITANMRDVLHWLTISPRIKHRIAAMVFRCVPICAPLTIAPSADKCRSWENVGC